MSEDNPENKKPQFELRDNGEIHFNKKGKSQLLAKYDDETGVLTFESFAVDQKYRTQICRAVMEDWVTGELTGNAVKAYAIHGRPVDKVRAGEPLPPKKDKMLGDKTPEFVKWLYRWRPQAFYARYGVFLDSNQEPMTAHCHRLEQGLLKPNTGKALEIGDRASEALGRTYIEKEDGILALRQTCLTFTKKEIVGAEDDENGDDDQDEPIPGVGRKAKAEDETETEPVPSAPKASRRKAKAVVAANASDEGDDA